MRPVYRKQFDTEAIRVMLVQFGAEIINVALSMNRQGVACPRHHRDNFQVRLFQSILDFGELLLKGVIESVVLLVEEVANAVRELLHFTLVWRSTLGLELGLHQEKAIAGTVEKNRIYHRNRQLPSRQRWNYPRRQVWQWRTPRVSASVCSAPPVRHSSPADSDLEEMQRNAL
jgi:hypothetical protein